MTRPRATLAQLVTDPLGPSAFGRGGTWLVFGLLAYCAFFDLGSRSLHVHDTARWGQLAREMIQGGEWLVPHRYGDLYVNKPPLYLWAVAAPAAAFGGVTPFWVRLPSALGFFALVWVTMRWTHMRFDSRRLARVAGLLTMTTLSVIWLGREGRLDMFASALAVAAAWQWDRAALGRGTRATPWVAGVLLGLALLSKGPPLLIPCVAILLTPGQGQRWGERIRAAKPWIVLPVGIALALAWFVPAVLHAGWAEYGRKLLVDQAADRIGGTSTHTHGPLYYFGAVPLAMAPWGIAYVAALVLVWRPANRRALGATAPVAIAGALALLVFVLVPTKHVRYLTPLVPLWAMPVARGAWRWVHRQDGFEVPTWTRIHAGLALTGGLAAAGLALFARYDRAWWIVLVAVPMLGLAWLLFRTRPTNDATGRRQFFGSFLVGVALLLVAILALRNRWTTTVKETFANAIRAELRPTDRVATLHGNTPELIFHVSPKTRRYLHTGDVPWNGDPGARWIVVINQDLVEEVETVSGRRAKLIAKRDPTHTVSP